MAAICPLGAIEAALAEHSVLPRVLIVLLLVLLVIVVFGRAFCAWICPVPLLQRWFPGLRRQKKELDAATAAIGKAIPVGDRAPEAAADAADAPCSPDAATASPGPGATDASSLCGKPKNFKLRSQHLVLGGSLLSAAVFGFPVFCLICPVGLTFASLLIIYRLFGFGEVTWSVIVFPLILVLELVVFRKWCSKLCPLGALMSLAAGLNRFFRPQIDDQKCLATKGIDCSVCAQSCSRENVDIRRPGLSDGAFSDCTKCRDCADSCPTKAISFPFIAYSKKQRQSLEPVEGSSAGFEGDDGRGR